MKASHISCYAVKLRCADEWGRWDRLSDDGPGQHNPDRSEGPWGRAASAVRTVVRLRTTPPTLSGDSVVGSGPYEGQMQTDRHCLVGIGKALSDIPALKPYWGKPAVRNFREAMETSVSTWNRSAPLLYPILTFHCEDNGAGAV